MDKYQSSCHGPGQHLCVWSIQGRTQNRVKNDPVGSTHTLLTTHDEVTVLYEQSPQQLPHKYTVKGCRKRVEKHISA